MTLCTRVLLSLLALVGLAAPAAAQCPGDPTSGNPATRQLVLSLGTTIPATAPDAMLRMAAAIQAQGHAVSVMDNSGPSDHKAWIDGEAWTWRSSDPVRCPVITWSPYLQGAYDGSGFSACGIPNSAHLGCPSWFTAPVPVPVVLAPPVVVAPPPTPPPAPVAVAPLNLDLTPILAKLDQIVALETSTNTQVTAMNRTVGQTLGAVMTFVGKYIAPAVAAYIAAKKL